MNITSIIMSAIGFAYAAIIMLFTLGWFKLNSISVGKSHFSTFVSIIIPARNEEKNIITCLNHLLLQNYPKNLFEIIIVDDSSTDHTAELVEKFILVNEYHGIKIRLLKLSETAIISGYKKAAIKHGILNSSGNLIITTDADCESGEKWISSIASMYEAEHPKMIVAPVKIVTNNTFFSRLQALEFQSMIASTAGAIGMNRPIMCNGANLAYSREAFFAVGGFDGNENFASGDDLFLLFKICNRFDYQSIKFLKDSNAMIMTQPMKTYKDFLSQRLRWVSKSKGYKNITIIITAMVVYLFNLVLIAGLMISFFNAQFINLEISLFLLKILFDFPLMLSITRFAKQQNLMWFYLPLQVLNSFYTVGIGLVGNFVRTSWKGRKL
jgi:Glycosyltransferases, probably involved in cell wall biogenesis